MAAADSSIRHGPSLPVVVVSVVMFSHSLAADYQMSQGRGAYHSSSSYVEKWQGVALKNLDMHEPARPTHKMELDRALMTAVSMDGAYYHVYASYDVCYKCPWWNVGPVYPDTNLTVVMNSTSACRIDIAHRDMHTQNSTNLCSFHMTFKEHGIYEVQLNAAADVPCQIVITKAPSISFLPIYLVLLIFIVLGILWTIFSYTYQSPACHRMFRRCQNTEGLVDSDLGSTNAVAEVAGTLEPPRTVTPPKQRLRSLDTFRGFSLVIMIFVNYGGGSYWFFHHSTWNGLTVADLVFPWFVFMMGTSMPLAFRGLLNRNAPRHLIAYKVVKRTVILFFFGLMLSNFGSKAVELSTIRIPGVLQRLALTYFVVAMLQVCFGKKENQQQAYRWWAPVRDIFPYLLEWVIVLVLVAVHLGLTFGLQVEGCPRGYLGPGGIEEDSEHWNCTGGAAAAIDKWVFGESHIYQHPTCKRWYITSTPHDPEGLLGTLTSILLCYLGLQAGRILTIYKEWRYIVPRWLGWGLLTGILAGTLCEFRQNEGWIPVNKNLWSLSFVLAMACFAFVLLSIFYLIIDVCNIWNGAPFLYPGMNSIVVYMCHEIFAHYFPIQFKVPSTHAYQLAMDVYGTALWVIMAYVMYKKNIFIAI